MLEVRALCKRFGGVVATDNVSLDVADRGVHALIGPNGAGKSTLVALISGSLAPDAGDVRFGGASLVRRSQHRRVLAGITRSFQTSSFFPRESVLDNLALAVQATSGASLSCRRPAARDAATFDAARAIAADTGLEACLDVPAETLAHGDQRVLDVAIALATRPRLVLLDEPMAGLGPEESRRMVALIDRMRAGIGVLLVEHDMDAVFRLADRVSVLVAGRVLATGAPGEVRSNDEVRSAYLGDGDAPRD